MKEQIKPLKVNKDRNANYKLLPISKKFTPVTIDRMIDTCANIRQSIEPLPIDIKEWGEYYGSTFSHNMSAPYVLSRLCALFNGLKIDVGGQDYYKITWQTVLEHKKTGHVITFYDSKGGISYGSDIYGDKTPEPFIKDVKKLINTLMDDRCPHPYDGCVVGEQA